MYVSPIPDSENLMNNNNWTGIYYDGWIIRMGGESNEGEMGQTMKMMKVGSQELKLHQCFRMQR